MNNKSTIIYLFGFLFLFSSSCSTKWSKAIRKGSVAQHEFYETVNTEIKEGLMFIPVTIRGKKYRFLFDTGAPLSLSKKLQDKYLFEIISKGNIIDSDHNRKQVNWVQLDSINIGEVTFLNQTAFIGDFEANPILECLEIDGIVGSNIIRQCNWTIDPQQKQISLSSSLDQNVLKEGITIPFKTDIQYNIFIDVNFGQSTVRNILMDYGSNGAIALSNEIFTTLKDRQIISSPLVESGIKQSGIIGKSINLNREMVFTDSVSIHHISLKNVMIRTGKTVSVGNDLLSRFRVTIDWNHKNLHLKANKEIKHTNSIAGFKLGYGRDKGIYVQSVIKDSNAYNKGIRPNMSVLKLDQLDFKNGDNFCDYLDHEFKNEIFIKLMNEEGIKLEFKIEKTNYK